ncbi:MAG: hypothetical protein ACYSUQ_11835, partial [Planctomycetota bacterium]
RNDRKVSPRKQSGLIARGKKAQQSAKAGSALDNRSHRTVMRFSCAPPERKGHPNKSREHALCNARVHAAQQRPKAVRR